ncbi:MAG: phage holin family protein [Brevundimonas sp.]
MKTPNERSLGELIADLRDQIASLIRTEIALAKAEVTGRVQKISAGAGLVIGAIVLAFYVLAAAIATAIIALSVPFEPWLAGLIVTVFLALVVALLAWLGVRELKRGTPPGPLKAIDGLQHDVDAVKEAI